MTDDQTAFDPRANWSTTYASKTNSLTVAGWVVLILSFVIGGALGFTHKIVEIDIESTFGGTSESFNWTLAIQAFGPLFIGSIIMLVTAFIVDELSTQARVEAPPGGGGNPW